MSSLRSLITGDVPKLPELPAHWWLRQYQWYRRLRPGHWECWWFSFDGGGLALWVRLLACTRGTLYRPSGPSRGTPVCEDW